MGTRGNVLLYHQATKVGGFYVGFDAYPTGLGVDIKKILNDGAAVIVNGYGPHQKAPAYFNGMGCLGAYLLGKLKGDEIGDVYMDLDDPVEKQGGYQDWTYRLILRNNDPVTGQISFSGDSKPVLTLEAYYWEKKVWDGPLAEFNPEAVEKLAYGEEEEEGEA